MTSLDYALISMLAAAVNIVAAIWNVRQGIKARRRKAVDGGESVSRARVR